jgi:putative endonuclease
LSRHKGDIYEEKASEYLKALGFKIIERNYYARKFGEIDIIAFKDGVYHFVEVKSGDGFEAVYNITPTKLKKLINSVNYYIKAKNLDCEYSIDAIIFNMEELEFIENITF